MNARLSVVVMPFPNLSALCRSVLAIAALWCTLAGCSLTELEQPPSADAVGELPGGCCDEEQCAPLGRVCNPDSCLCEVAQCCTPAICNLEGQVCNTESCVCEDPACCTTASCAMEGKVCNTETCMCEETTCCTDQQCLAAGGKVCNTETCMCEEPSCCTEAGCAAQGRVCNTETCMCEDAPCCTQAICTAQGNRICNTETCMCEEPSCCQPGDCDAGEYCNTGSCMCEPCCTNQQCALEGKSCNTETCQCETPCCTDAQCAQNGDICNTDTCMCEEPPCCTDAECLAQNKICNTQSCMCEEPVCCDEQLCANQNQVCNTLACQCVDPDPGPCSLAGNPCDPNATQPVNFVCIDDGNGGGVCRDFCVLDANNPGDPCQLGTYCKVEPGQPGPEFVGFCAVSECPGFFAGGCASGEKCVPNGNATNVCTEFGSTASGQSCSAIGDCDQNLLCVGGTCETPDCAALSGMPACSQGDECGGLVLGSEPLDLGFCFTPCTVFDDPTTCPSGEWCSPRSRNNQTGLLDGECIPTSGTDQLGDSCTSGSCAADLICVSGTCEALCDPDASSGTQGACSSGQGCSPLEGTDSAGNPVDLEIGICLDSCNYHGSGSCTDGTLECFPGELFGEAFDLCLDAPSSGWPLSERANCTSAGLAEFDVCNYNSVCLLIPSISSSVLCYDLCMTSEGAFGSSPHADCRNSSRSCENFFTSATTFGLCQ